MYSPLLSVFLCRGDAFCGPVPCFLLQPFREAAFGRLPVMVAFLQAGEFKAVIELALVVMKLYAAYEIDTSRGTDRRISFRILKRDTAVIRRMDQDSGIVF